jgi:hypothetical protein
MDRGTHYKEKETNSMVPRKNDPALLNFGTRQPWKLIEAQTQHYNFSCYISLL